MDRFSQHFESEKPRLKALILEAFKNSPKNPDQLGYRSVWEYFEAIVTPVLIEFLQGDPFKIPAYNITKPKGKSSYPDVKVKYNGRLYAIDVKSGEDVKDPWYDIPKLDTYEEKHLKVYEAEYSVVVKWTGRDNVQVLNIFIEPTYQTVGYRAASKGVKYRPYDGKIRPKTWADFDNGVVYWKTKEEFKVGLEASLRYRRRSFIAEWYKSMDTVQREQIKGDFDAIDAGKIVVLDNVEENGGEEG